MSIEEAIEERLDRFDNLYLKATGHTFREDPAFCEAQNIEKQDKYGDLMLQELENNGYKDLKDYFKDVNFNGVKKIDAIEDLCKKMVPEQSLYDYEISCLNQCKDIVNFLNKYDDPKKEWKKISNGKNAFDIAKSLESEGFKVNDDHSGNSLSASMLFVNCYMYNPELFKYMHGALASLVGDVGYHDDRSDLPPKK